MVRLKLASALAGGGLITDLRDSVSLDFMGVCMVSHVAQVFIT